MIDTSDDHSNNPSQLINDNDEVKSIIPQQPKWRKMPKLNRLASV